MVMDWIDRLERKCRWLKIPHLMLYIVIGNGIVYFFDLLFVSRGLLPFSYFLAFSPSLILQGQVWRVITFVFLPPGGTLFLLVIALYFYYFVGTGLESVWGSGRFTIYYLLGIIGSIIAGCITGWATAAYLNLSLFFAFAYVFPDMQVLLFFVIPIKMKYLGYINAAYFLYVLIVSPLSSKLAALMAILNFFIFFGPSLIRKCLQRGRAMKNKRAFQQKMNQSFRR